MIKNAQKSRSVIGFFFSLISYGHLFAMDAEQEKNSFLFLELPAKVQDHIWDYLTINNSGPVKETTKTLNSFAQVNKEYNTRLNNPVITKKLIKDFAQNFQCSDEEVVEGLQTQEAKRVQKQQDMLFVLCAPECCRPIKELVWPREVRCKSVRSIYHICCMRDRKICIRNANLGLWLSQAEYEEIIKKGVDCDKVAQVHKLRMLAQTDIDFQFTYYRRYDIKNITPFMALCSTETEPRNREGLLQIMEFFVDYYKKNCIDINAINLINLLCIYCEALKGYSLTAWAYEPLRESKLINVNKQDEQGNTALMNCLINIHKGPWRIYLMIKIGVDPRIGNKAGVTPLKQLEQIEKESVYDVSDQRRWLESAIRDRQQTF